jgi:hypothetical protein
MRGSLTAERLAKACSAASLIAWLITALLRFLGRITVDQAAVGFGIAVALLLCSGFVKRRIRKGAASAT